MLEQAFHNCNKFIVLPISRFLEKSFVQLLFGYPFRVIQFSTLAKLNIIRRKLSEGENVILAAYSLTIEVLRLVFSFGEFLCPRVYSNFSDAHWLANET